MKHTNHYISWSLGVLLTFSSQNLGDKNVDISVSIEPQEETPKKEASTNTKVKPSPKKEEWQPDISILPKERGPMSELGKAFGDSHTLYRDNSRLDLSIENYLNGDITTVCNEDTPPQQKLFCLPVQGELTQEDSASKLFKTIPDVSTGLSYEPECLLLNRNSNNTQVPLSTETSAKCLGGIDISTSAEDSVKIKIRGTMTYDPKSDVTEDKTLGLCPEGELSECTGVEIGVELNY